MMVLEGTVVGLLDHGFLVDAGGAAPTRVATQTEGSKLGLRPGDRVSVFGGYGGGDVFASSRATKLWLGFSLAVPVNAYERLPWWRRLL